MLYPKSCYNELCYKEAVVYLAQKPRTTFLSLDSTNLCQFQSVLSNFVSIFCGILIKMQFKMLNYKADYYSFLSIHELLFHLVGVGAAVKKGQTLPFKNSPYTTAHIE